MTEQQLEGDYPISPWMTMGEVCAYLVVTRQTVNNYVRAGKLTKHTIGGYNQTRFRRAEVEALIQPVTLAE